MSNQSVDEQEFAVREYLTQTDQEIAGPGWRAAAEARILSRLLEERVKPRLITGRPIITQFHGYTEHPFVGYGGIALEGRITIRSLE